MLVQYSTRRLPLTGALVALMGILASLLMMHANDRFFCNLVGCLATIHIEVESYDKPIPSPFHGRMHAPIIHRTRKGEVSVARDFNFTCRKTSTVLEAERPRKHWWCPQPPPQPVDVAFIDFFVRPPRSVEIKLWLQDAQNESTTTFFEDEVSLERHEFDPNGPGCGSSCMSGRGRVSVQEQGGTLESNWPSLLSRIASSWCARKDRVPTKSWSCDGDVGLATIFYEEEKEEEEAHNVDLDTFLESLLEKDLQEEDINF